MRNIIPNADPDTVGQFRALTETLLSQKNAPSGYGQIFNDDMRRGLSPISINGIPLTFMPSENTTKSELEQIYIYLQESLYSWPIRRCHLAYYSQGINSTPWLLLTQHLLHKKVLDRPLTLESPNPSYRASLDTPLSVTKLISNTDTLSSTTTESIITYNGDLKCFTAEGGHTVSIALPGLIDTTVKLTPEGWRYESMAVSNTFLENISISPDELLLEAELQTFTDHYMVAWQSEFAALQAQIDKQDTPISRALAAHIAKPHAQSLLAYEVIETRDEYYFKHSHQLAKTYDLSNRMLRLAEHYEDFVYVQAMLKAMRLHHEEVIDLHDAINETLLALFAHYENALSDIDIEHEYLHQHLAQWIQRYNQLRQRLLDEIPHSSALFKSCMVLFSHYHYIKTCIALVDEPDMIANSLSLLTHSLPLLVQMNDQDEYKDFLTRQHIFYLKITDLSDQRLHVITAQKQMLNTVIYSHTRKLLDKLHNVLETRSAVMTYISCMERLALYPDCTSNLYQEYLEILNNDTRIDVDDNFFLRNFLELACIYNNRNKTDAERTLLLNLLHSFFSITSSSQLFAASDFKAHAMQAIELAKPKTKQDEDFLTQFSAMIPQFESTVLNRVAEYKETELTDLLRDTSKVWNELKLCITEQYIKPNKKKPFHTRKESSQKIITLFDNKIKEDPRVFATMLLFFSFLQETMGTRSTMKKILNEWLNNVAYQITGEINTTFDDVKRNYFPRLDDQSLQDSIKNIKKTLKSLELQQQQLLLTNPNKHQNNIETIYNKIKTTLLAEMPDKDFVAKPSNNTSIN